MNIKEFNNAVNSVLREVVSEGPKISAKVSNDALSLISDRIFEEGIEGASYSTNPLPAFYFVGKSISAQGDKRVKALNKSNKYKGVSYTQFRNANNLQTSHVDLKLSGEMWGDMAVLESKGKGFISTTIVGSKNAHTYPNGKTTGDVVDYLSDKYGDFLTPKQNEEEILTNLLDNELQQIINKYFI